MVLHNLTLIIVTCKIVILKIIWINWKKWQKWKKFSSLIFYLLTKSSTLFCCHPHWYIIKCTVIHNYIRNKILKSFKISTFNFTKKYTKFGKVYYRILFLFLGQNIMKFTIFTLLFKENKSLLKGIKNRFKRL